MKRNEEALWLPLAVVTAQRALMCALACTLLTSGCSFVFASGPKARAPDRNPDCSAPPSAMLADGVLSGLLVTATIANLDEQDRQSEQMGNVILVAGAAALFAGSAVYGFSLSRQCERAKDRFAKASASRAAKEGVPRVGRAVPRVETEGTEGNRCFANQSCLHGLRCDATVSRCVAAPAGALGSTCDGGDECSAGLACEAGICATPTVPQCARDVHCDGGATCVSGRCERRASPASPESAPVPSPL